MTTTPRTGCGATFSAPPIASARYSIVCNPVADAQHGHAAAAVQADLDLVGFAVADRVAHRFLSDADEVRCCLAAEAGTSAVVDQHAMRAVRAAHIACQSAKRIDQAAASDGDRRKTACEIARFTDRLVQQPQDFGGRRGRAGTDIGREVARQGCRQRRDTGQRLT